MNRDEFHRGLNSRTLAYLPEFKADARPVVLFLGESGYSFPGQVLLLGLVNMLARAHQRIIVVGDVKADLLGRDPFGHRGLEGAITHLATGVNPVIEFDAVEKPPPHEPLITLGLAVPAEQRIGCAGWTATFGEDAAIGGDRGSITGAILAACLGAATAFHRQVGRSGRPEGVYSLWDYGAASGMQGPDMDGPLDVGRVLQVGVGAVGAALDYWMAFLGFAGSWSLADGDQVDVTNLNRQLYFLAVDAGWDDQPIANKADVVAGRLGTGALSSPHMYGVDEHVVEADYDVILPLANEGGVRPALQSRAEPVLLHATTTPNWTSIAHRHVVSLDDCIVCRLQNEEDPSFTCSTGSTDSTRRNDASLPFLSGLAGALLLRDLIALQAGRLVERGTNFAAINLAEPVPLTRELRWACRSECKARLPASVRRPLADGSRFAHLDREV